MRTKQQSSQCRVPRARLLLTLTTIILFSCSQRSLAQQRDGEATNADSNSSNTAPNRSAVNFNFNFANLTLLNGEFLEAFGANNSRGILRGHPTIPGTELGTTTADPLMFSTNSVERMRIASNGNVGIGTSTPQEAFHLFNTTNTVGTMRLQGGNTYAGFIGVWEGDSSLLLTNNRHPGTGNNYNTARIGAQLFLRGGDMHFYTTASGTVGTVTELMRIKANGNVGIGTSDPQDAFHVFNTTNWVGTMRLQGGNTHAGFIGMTEGGQSLVLSNNRHPGTGANYNTAKIGAQLALWEGDIHFWTTTSGTVGGNVELMRIKSSGNVGIGTPTPAFRLDVQGGAINAAGGLCIAGDCKTAWPQVGPSSSQWTTSGTSIFYNSGNVGIGTETPGARLHVSAGNSSFALFGPNVEWGGSLAVGSGTSFLWPISGRAQVLSSNGNLHLDAGTNQNVYIGWFNGSHTIINAQGGNVGIGTSTPASNLQIGTQAVVASAAPTTLSLGGSHSNAAGANLKLKLYDDGVAGNTYGIGVSASSMDFGVPSGVTYKWYGGGVNKMTLTTNGDLSVSGSIAAKYQDVAEWVDSSQELVAGTVVVLDSSRSNHVIAATQSYDSRIAGVISLQPGLTLGEEAEGRVLVATTGRVRVKVDATEGAIQIGDLLVTSNREGFAMKSLPVDVGGVRMHRPGTLIGKALEPLTSGTGQILVLLSLQ